MRITITRQELEQISDEISALLDGTDYDEFEIVPFNVGELQIIKQTHFSTAERQPGYSTPVLYDNAVAAGIVPSLGPITGIGEYGLTPYFDFRFDGHKYWCYATTPTPA